MTKLPCNVPLLDPLQVFFLPQSAKEKEAGLFCSVRVMERKPQMPLYSSSIGECPSVTDDPSRVPVCPDYTPPPTTPDPPPFLCFGRMFVNPLAKGSAKAFTLLGTERMAPPHSCFPSDHFGMDARFEW